MLHIVPIQMPYKTRAKCPHREVAATRSRTRSRSPETKWKFFTNNHWQRVRTTVYIPQIYEERRVTQYPLLLACAERQRTHSNHIGAVSSAMTSIQLGRQSRSLN